MSMPSRIGPYELIEEIGRGAMGVVFRGFDPAIGRSVAIKIIRSDPFAPSLDQDEARRRFSREAAAAGKLSHPGIVTVFHLGNEGEHQYLVMELVAGQSLDKLLVEGTPVEIPNALDILRQLSGALDYAHRSDVIHRDIKPANIMVSPEGMVKIADFGIARILSGTLTLTGTVLGTPAYMAPEQIMARKVGARADQFSLAVMAYQILTGHRPFEASSATEMMHQILYTEPQPVHVANPALPLALDSVFQRALSKDPEERFGSCTEFVAVIERLLAGSRLQDSVVAGAIHQAEGENHINLAPAGAAPLIPARGPSWLERHRSLVSAAVGACLAALALALFLVRTHTPAKRLESAATKEASALASPPIAAPIVAEPYPVPASTKMPPAGASHPTGSSSPAPGAPPASSGSVAFKATNADTGVNWAVTANISGTVKYEGQFLKVEISDCVLSRHTSLTSPVNIAGIGVGVSRPTSATAGRWNVQRESDYYSIRQSLLPGQKVELPPFILNVPIDNFEVKAGDWLTFSVRLKDIKNGKETVSVYPIHWHSLVPPPAGLPGGPATVQGASPATAGSASSATPTADPTLTANARVAEVKHAMGLQLLDQQKHLEAISSFTEAISLNPRFAEAYLDRCRAYVRVPLRDRAIEDCNRAIELRAAYPEAYLWRGHAKNLGSASEETSDDFTEAIRLNSEFYEGYVARGIFFTYGSHKRPDLAIRDFTQAIRVKPTDYYAYYLRGVRFAEQKQYDFAIRDYGESIRLRPWATSYIFRGDAYRMQEQYQRAVQDYNEAIRLWPSSVGAYAARATAKDSLGDKAGAAADRQRAEELKSAASAAQPSTVSAPAAGSSPTADARAAEVKQSQGLQLEQQRKLSEAISAFTEAIRLKPDFADAYYHRCSCYGMLNIPAMNARAVEDCTKAIEIQRDLEGAYEYRGLLYLGQHNYDRAIEDASEAIRLNPNDAGAYHVRAGAYAGQNRADLAIKDYTVSLRIRPSWNNYYYRAEQYVRQQQADLAIQDCTEAIRLYADYALSYKVRGDAYQLKHEYDRAIQDYNEAIRLSPKHGPAYTARAAAKEILGDKTGAAADRQRVQELSVGKL